MQEEKSLTKCNSHIKIIRKIILLKKNCLDYSKLSMPLQNKIRPEISSKLKGNEDPGQLNAIYKQ